MSAKKAVKSFRVQVLETFSALITAAFGLVAALAWNEAIKAAINNIPGLSSEGGIWGLVIYAIIVTFIAVIMTIVIAVALAKAKGKDEEEEEEEE